MPPADGEAFARQQVAQHPAARERMLQVQLVDPAHQRQIRRRHRTRLVVHAAPADAQKLACRLTGSSCERRSSLGARQAGLVERAGQKIVLQRQLPDLGVQCLQIHRRRRRRPARIPPPRAIRNEPSDSNITRTDRCAYDNDARKLARFPINEWANLPCPGARGQPGIRLGMQSPRSTQPGSPVCSNRWIIAGLCVPSLRFPKR